MPGEDSFDQAATAAELMTYRGPDRVITSKEFWEIEGARPTTEHKFRLCIPRLDNLVDGVESGELIVVSGPTGEGKTTLCDTLGRGLTKQDARCLWFSFEVTPKKFLEKYKPENSPIIYIPLERKPGSLLWLETKVWEAKLKYDCRVVFIDHLHFIVDMTKMRNPSIEIGAAMRFLKTEIALKYNVVVFLISHLTKTVIDQEPTANDLRDSSFIAQEADGVWIIIRSLDEGKTRKDDNPFSNRAKILICKSRRTGVLKDTVRLVKIGNDLVEEESEPAKRDPMLIEGYDF